jgi:hypothetical protein
MPSLSRISAIAAETSGSSRWTTRGAISTTLTSLPKRRYIWANSNPTQLPPTITKWRGTKSTAIIELFVR